MYSKKTIKNEIKQLYNEYHSIQGSEPIFLTTALSERIENRQYKESTMRAIVGLLRAYVENYEVKSEGRNCRYAVHFRFSRLDDLSGPYLEVSDAVDEKGIAYIVWNHGKVKILDTITDDDADFIKAGCAASISKVRKKLRLRDNRLWSILDRENILDTLFAQCDDFTDDFLCKYDLTWDEIDPSGKLSPISGLNAVVQDQLAEHLKVPITWLRKKKIEFSRGIININQAGIVVAKTEEVCDEVGASADSWGGVNLMLENGNTIHITKSQKMYFSAIAAAWLIDRVRQDPEYKEVYRGW